MAVDARGFWASIGAPKYVCAPMVEQSERAFRRCCVVHGGVGLCYTPMIHSDAYAADPAYRRQQRIDDVEEAPVVAQICAQAGAAAAALESVKLLSQYKSVVAVDLNMGCPQINAQKHEYGAYLPLDAAVDIIKHMVDGQHAERQPRVLPITAKIRIQPTLAETIERVQRLIDAGAVVIAIHGRLRTQIQRDTGVADWGHVRDVIAHFRDGAGRATNRGVAFMCNGNITMRGDADECLRMTGADAVMSADALLWDFTLFNPRGQLLRSGRMFYEHLPVAATAVNDADAARAAARARLAHSLQLARWYLHAALEYPPTCYQVKQHLLKLLRPCIAKYPFIAAQFVDRMPPVIDPLIKGTEPGTEVHFHRSMCMWRQLVDCFACLENDEVHAGIRDALPVIGGGDARGGAVEGLQGDGHGAAVDRTAPPPRCFTTAVLQSVPLCAHDDDCADANQRFVDGGGGSEGARATGYEIAPAETLLGPFELLAKDVTASLVAASVLERERVFATTPSAARECLATLPALDGVTTAHYTLVARRLAAREAAARAEADEDLCYDLF